MTREWPKEDPYDISDLQNRGFKDREEAERLVQDRFDKLKAEGKIPESLHTAVMSDRVTVGIKYLVYQSMMEAHDQLRKMAQKAGRRYDIMDKTSLFLNYSNMMMQVVKELIEESLRLEYELTLEFERFDDKLKDYKDKSGLK